MTKAGFEGKRVILLIRDPRDIVVSMYFFKARRSKCIKYNLSSFLRFEKRGSIDSIISWYNAWANSRHLPAHLLLVRYEDMHENPQKELRRVLNFIRLHEINKDIIHQVVEYTHFNNMHKLETENAFDSRRLQPKDKKDPDSYMTRRGQVGGFVDYLSKTDIEYLNQKINGELSNFYSFYK